MLKGANPNPNYGSLQVQQQITLHCKRVYNVTYYYMKFKPQGFMFCCIPEKFIEFPGRELKLEFVKIIDKKTLIRNW